MDPGDAGAVDDLVRVAEAVRLADAPWQHPTTRDETLGELVHGWEGDPATGYLARVDGVAVAAGEYSVSAYDNHHLAWVHVAVHPAHRRRGHGSAVLAVLRDRARSEGRTTLAGGGWDSPAVAAFAARHGLAPGSVEVSRRQELAATDRARLAAAYDGARRAARDYEMLRLPARSPDAMLPALAALTAAINDAPTDDLAIEDGLYPPARIAAYEAAQAGRGHRLHRLVARERASGELAGQSVVAVEAARPEIAEQHDTSVLAAHRGHRLGLLLKLEMMRWLEEVEPRVETIDTWNAESNGRMIAVNELLGYRVLGRELIVQGPTG